MNRAATWICALITAAVAIAINVLIEKHVGFDISSFCILVAIPVGVMALAAVGLSGFLFGTFKWNWKPGPVDLAFLMCLALAIPLVIYGVQYVSFLDEMDPTRRPSFGSFVYDQITNAMVTIRTRQFDDAPPQPAAELGLIIAVIKLGALPAVAKIVHSMSASPGE